MSISTQRAERLEEIYVCFGVFTRSTNYIGIHQLWTLYSVNVCTPSAIGMCVVLIGAKNSRTMKIE